MKTIKLFIMMVCVSITSLNAKTIFYNSPEDMGRFEKMAPCTLRLKLCFAITGRIGHDDPCRELSIKCLKLEKCNRVADFNLNNVNNDQCKLIIEQTSSTELTISYLAYDVTSDYFILDKDWVLPKEICREFGVNSFVIPAGKYFSKKDSSGIWTTTFKLKN